jgi:nucleoid-associated protein YgaU
MSQRRPSAEEAVPPPKSIQRSASDPTAEPPTDNPPPRTHWITDGDTLQELAFRFLGDRNRWREIREANRDVLTTDDILPIGKEIRIPARAARNSSAPPQTAEESQGLVPIPWKD